MVLIPMEIMDVAEPLAEGIKYMQHMAAGFGALSAVCAGTVDAWPAVSIPFLEESYNSTGNVTVSGINYEQGSWIGSLAPMGSLFGAIPTGYLANTIGRRKLLLHTAIPMVLLWLTIVFGYHIISILYASRLMLGIICGVITVVLPLYCEEIAEVKVRGSLGIYLISMFNLGILLTYIIGTILPYFWMTVSCNLLPVIFALAFYDMPESPIYLLSKGRIEEAEKALRRLRGRADVRAELEQMQASIRASPSNVPVPVERKFQIYMLNFIRHRLLDVETMRAIFIIFGLMAFRQLIGMNAIITYTVDIFQDAGNFMSPYISTIIIGFVQLGATLLPFWLVDRTGRRLFLILSGSGAFIGLLIMVIHFSLLMTGIEVGWLPLLGLILYGFACSIGIAPLPWFIMPELLNNENKGWVTSTAVCFNWTLSFVVTKFFPNMVHEFGPMLTYLTFTGIAMIGTLFIYFFVPETKNKTREEIRNDLVSKWVFH